MSVEFEEDRQNNPQYLSRKTIEDTAEPSMVRWLSGKGFFKNEAQVRYFLIAIIVFCFVLSGIIIYMHSVGATLPFTRSPAPHVRVVSN